MLSLFQILLLPLSFLYELILRFRNYLYDSGFSGQTEFDLPVINIGNLAFGGTGKTPHIEYLIRLLRDHYKPAVLSRGYRRKTKGYVFAGNQSTAKQIGDEPQQIHLGFPEIPVAVSENRVLGVPNLLMDAPETNVILLDDAFQHRRIKPGLNLLLTDFNRLFTRDRLVPSGYLREYRGGAGRADIIVVTKCPDQLTEAEKETIRKEIQPKPNQLVVFSGLKYGPLTSVFSNIPAPITQSVALFTSIANPDSLLKEVAARYATVNHHFFADHHFLTEQDLRTIEQLHKTLPESNGIIITTSKDHSKLVSGELPDWFKSLPIYYLPVEVWFDDTEKVKFENRILDYLNTYFSSNGN